MEHDMFTEQPVSADVYMFPFVFDDWPILFYQSRTRCRSCMRERFGKRL